LTDVQVDLLRARAVDDATIFARLAELCDDFARVTFAEPVEGYVRRMLWAAAAEGALPDDACDDPWGPPLDPAERLAVRQAVQDARAARR
jgi:4-hydroxy-tetrahydrodipicolinate synthase